MVEGEEYTYGFVSDIHCGSVYFDYPAFKKTIEKLKDMNVKARHLYLLGDLIEGKLNHRGQLYEAFPLDYQIAILRSIVERLVLTLGARHLYILPGNHDRKYGLNLLDTFILKNQADFEKMGSRSGTCVTGTSIPMGTFS
ncbi:MAG: metallophosphoesterase [Nanopusillaceae archaeon]